MSTLSDLLAEHTTLPGSAVAHLQRLVSEWQLLSDLSFSDLSVWVPTEPGAFVCVAQVRPTTGPTAHPDDLVARPVSLPVVDAAAPGLGGGAHRRPAASTRPTARPGLPGGDPGPARRRHRSR